MEVIKTKVIVTNHASTRYAERIADRDTTLDINAYVAKNKEKIENDINAMIEHSQFIHKGKFGTKDNNIVNVYLSGTWVLLLDSSNSRVITLYKIDFNVGEDFNKQFIQKILERMDVHKKLLEEKKKQIETEKQSYLNIIKDNDGQIQEYKTMIKRLEKSSSDYREVVNNIDAEFAALELAIKRDVEDLVMRHEF